MIEDKIPIVLIGDLPDNIRQNYINLGYEIKHYKTFQEYSDSLLNSKTDGWELEKEK